MRFNFAVFYAKVVMPVAVLSQIAADGNDGNHYYRSSLLSVDDDKMAELVAYADGFEADLRDENETVAVRFRLRTWQSDDNSSTVRGCGFHVRVDGDQDGSASLHFPASREHGCIDTSAHTYGAYLMRTTSATVTYDERLRLSSGRSERAERVEVRAEGHSNSYVKILCMGLYDRITGYHPVCINTGLWAECSALSDQQVGGVLLMYSCIHTGNILKPSATISITVNNVLLCISILYFFIL